MVFLRPITEVFHNCVYMLEEVWCFCVQSADYFAEIQLVLKNAVKWACPAPGIWLDNYTRKATPPVEDIQERGPKLHEPGSEGLR